MLRLSRMDLVDFDPYSLLLFDLESVPLPLPLTRTRYFHQEIVSSDLFGSDLLALCDRVSALESKFDRLVSSRRLLAASDSRFTWTAEVKGKEAGRKYKLVAEIKGPKDEGKGNHHFRRHHLKDGNKSYKWIAEIKGEGEQGPITRTYTWKASDRDADESTESGSDKEEEKKKHHHHKIKKHDKMKKKGDKCTTRLVEIEESTDHGIVALRQAFARRAGAIRVAKGKNKDLSPQDAALLIQMSFKAYLVRRSRALRSLRELAIAKAKLKEIRALFNNFSYRRRIARDAEERQRFSERIIVLLLTVDAIEGADLMVRSSKKSMVDELEAMLEVVDPHPPGKSLSMKRRTFDVPDGVIQKEIAEGVSQIVRMLEEEEDQASSEI